VAFAFGVETSVECIPTAILELGSRGVERVLASAAAKVALLGKEAEVLRARGGVDAGVFTMRRARKT